MKAGDLLIDEGEIVENFVRASGPGGQNVNKVASAVELRFDARRSPSLPNDVAIKLIKLAGARATQDGVIVIFAQRFASQLRPREGPRARLAALLAQGAAAGKAAPPHAADARLEKAPARREGPAWRDQGAERVRAVGGIAQRSGDQNIFKSVAAGSGFGARRVANAEGEGRLRAFAIGQVRDAPFPI